MSSSDRAQLALVLGVTLLTLFVGLGRRELWNPVEPRYAGIAADVARGGPWLVPEYAGRPYDQKPPLYFWVGAALLELGDHDDRFLVRLPSALAGLALVVGTFGVGRHLFGGRVGGWSAALLATSYLPVWSSRFCHLDTAAVASVVWVLLAALTMAARDAPRRRVGWLAIGALACGAGLLVKGPAALGHIVAAALGMSLVARDRRLWTRGLLPIVGCGTVLAGSWLLAAALGHGTDWALQLVLENGVLHLVDETNAAKHGPGYYLAVLGPVGAPWTALLPFALVAGVSRSLAPDERRGARLCVAWLVATVIALHFGATYRSRYLLPALVPAALLSARFVDRDLATGRGLLVRTARVVAGGALGFFAVGLVAVGAVLMRPAWLQPTALPTEFVAALAAPSVGRLATGLGLAATAGFAAVTLLSGRSRSGLTALVVAVALVVVGWALWAAPAVDAWRGDRALIEAVRPIVAGGRRLVATDTYGDRESVEGFWSFHLGVWPQTFDREGVELGRITDREPMILLARERCLEFYPRCVPPGWRRVGEGPLGHSRILLFENDPAEPR